MQRSIGSGCFCCEDEKQTTQGGWLVPRFITKPPSCASCLRDERRRRLPVLRLGLMEKAGVTPDRPVIAYCRIGARSSHTWFVLKYLLGYPSVKNYDGSWTEWGNLVGPPVEKA